MITVTPARADQCSAALALIFARHPAAEQSACVRDMLESKRRGDICLDGLLLAEDDGHPIGAALYVLQPDNTAFVWPPVLTGRDDDSRVCDELYAELRRLADEADAWLSQCLVEVGDTADREALNRNGFEHLADLSYLERPLSEPLPRRRGFRFTTTTFDTTSEARFTAVLERTYIDTLDCPGLSGRRTAQEAIISHQMAGVFNPLQWKLYQLDGCDVGLLLMNDHPEEQACEVVYVGVVPEARGNDYGREMLIDGIQNAHAAGHRALLLAVDRRNSFARNVYRDVGFREIGVRAVHVRAHPNRCSAR